MPELPEVEHLRRTLEPNLIGARVQRVRLRRRDIFTRGAPSPWPSPHGGSSTPRRGGGDSGSRALLAGDTIAALARHGKNLAIIGASGRVLCVHLGMSGSLVVGAGKSSRRAGAMKHAHCVWEMKDLRLIFRDPRRFGGLWSFASMGELHQARWDRLGPDALTISARQLRQRLGRTTRAVKAALLDQSVLAGVGNIYADEALFRARIDPRSIAHAIPAERVAALAAAIRRTLTAAITAGGTTVISYVDGHGRSGEYAARLHVYGRGGEPCVRCGRKLRRIVSGQRTTAFCGSCQRRFR